MWYIDVIRIYAWGYNSMSSYLTSPSLTSSSFLLFPSLLFLYNIYNLPLIQITRILQTWISWLHLGGVPLSTRLVSTNRPNPFSSEPPAAWQTRLFFFFVRSPTLTAPEASFKQNHFFSGVPTSRANVVHLSKSTLGSMNPLFTGKEHDETKIMH